MTEATDRQLPVSIRHVLLGAGAIYLVVVGIVAIAGRYEFAGAAFDVNGFGPYANDSRFYAEQMSSLAATLRDEGVGAWLSRRGALHVRLYSIGFATIGKLVGENVLAIAAFNLALYLAMVYLAYAIGFTAFNATVGLSSAVFAALLPSQLLHYTQPLREPLFIAAFLLLVFACVTLVKGDLTRRRTVIAALGVPVAATLVWFTRHAFWPIVIVLFGATAVALLARGGAKGLVGRVVITAMLLAVAIGIPRLLNIPAVEYVVGSKAIILRNTGGDLPSRVNAARARFTGYRTGSRVDRKVRFESTGEVLAYVPRAALIGLCAPFPAMWFDAGKSTSAVARAVSGLEMILMWLLTAAALFSLWSERRHAPVWIIAIVVAAGLVGLGLTVPNVGALYRMRYVLWTLTAILGVATLVRMRMTKRD